MYYFIYYKNNSMRFIKDRFILDIINLNFSNDVVFYYGDILKTFKDRGWDEYIKIL